MNEVIVISPKTKSEFEAYYNLRWQMLRKPWGQPKGSERDKEDASSFHYMAINNGEVAGIVRLQFNTEDQAQLRYMAVSTLHQKKGIGKALVSHIEKEAVINGANELILQARENAVDFYKHCGYKIIKKTYLLFDSIQHYLMAKALT